MGARFPEKRALVYPPDPTCVLDIPMFEGVGSIVEDRSIYKNNGAVSGATWGSRGISGACLHFDGINQFVQCGASASLAVVGAKSVAFWMRIPSNNPDWTRIIQRASFDGLGFGVRISSNQVSFQVKAYSTRDNALFTSVLGLNQWYFVAGVYDGAASQLIYLDGVLGTGNWDDSMKDGGGTNFAIGKRAGEALNFFCGSLCGCCVYSRALSAQEILDIYERTKPTA